MTFDRVPAQFKPVIEVARAFLTPQVSEMCQPRFLCGTDPRFVGLHRYTTADLVASDARYDDWVQDYDYDVLAHALYGTASPDGKATICFPKLESYSDPVGTVLHEWGHLFDEVTGFVCDVPETTAYSSVNRRERFAEGFARLLRPPTGCYVDWANSLEALAPLRALVGLT